MPSCKKITLTNEFLDSGGLEFDSDDQSIVDPVSGRKFNQNDPIYCNLIIEAQPESIKDFDSVPDVFSDVLVRP